MTEFMRGVFTQFGVARQMRSARNRERDFAGLYFLTPNPAEPETKEIQVQSF